MRSTTAQTVPVSALPRPLDFSFPSNRVAVCGAALFGALALLLGRSPRQALGVGGSSLLAWATGRELDPDSPASAAVALGLAGISGLVQTGKNQTGQNQRAQKQTAQDRAVRAQTAKNLSGRKRNVAPAILPGLAVLSAVRLLTGTVGYAATRSDTLALSVQAGAAALAGYPVAAALPAAALAHSAAQQDTLRPHTEWGAALALGAGLLPQVAGHRISGSAGRQVQNKSPGTLLSTLLSLGALSLGRKLTAAEQPLSQCDQVPLTVSASRLRASRVMGLGALAAGLLRGESASLVPLAAACLGTGLRRAVHGRSSPEQSERSTAETDSD